MHTVDTVLGLDVHTISGSWIAVLGVIAVIFLAMVLLRVIAPINPPSMPRQGADDLVLEGDRGKSCLVSEAEAR